MKQCGRCEVHKPVTSFQEREDSWDVYSWCNECRAVEGRMTLTPHQKRFMDKTQMFFTWVENV